MKIALLHLSDIHIQHVSCPILTRAEKICATVNTLLPDVRGVLITVTGDIAFSGTKEEYVLAKKFFDALITCIKSRVADDVVVYMVVVPGNHDGEFKHSSGARKGLIETVIANQEIDDSVIEVISAPQKNYFDFENSLPNEFNKFSDPLWKQHSIKIDDKIISISAINVSWMSQVPEEPGKLVFPVDRYADQAKAKADVRIALIHHPLNWYSQATYHPLRALCRSQYEIVMSGHEHTSSATLSKELDIGENLMLECGALWPHKSGDSEFCVITLDLSTQEFAKVKFIWKDNCYMPSQGEAVWDSFNPLPKKKNELFAIDAEFRRRLEDVGATFTHPNKEKLVLSDIYVYPELTKIDPVDDTTEIVSGKIFATDILKIGKAVLRGDDQFGKSALLHTLYQNYLNIGYVPLLVNGKDIGNTNDEQFQRKLIAAVENQYGKKSINTYGQLDKESKILLVDDLDRAGLHPDAIARALNSISRHFSYSVVTVSERFDMAEATSSKTVEAAQSFHHYRFSGFGFKLRSELIARWLSVGQALTESELQALCHASEQTIDTVIGKGLVPTTAFNVLILLQSMEAGSKGTLANAGMAQYYEFLIRRSLFQAKLRAEQFDEIFSYISYLAWHFTKLRVKSLDATDLISFNEYFSNHVLETEFSSRMDFLVKCRILTVMGNTYSFRYHYIKYFFSAKYIADHVDDEVDLKDYVIHACNHLYLRENANTILFLSHHAPNKWIIREIEKTLKKILEGISPLNIVSDTKVLNGWVTKTAQLIVDTTNIKNNRDKQRVAADKAASRVEVEQKSELNSISDLDFASQINLLFKTGEILGQILKNRYGSLDKTFKQDLMKELFDGPLRGINYFLQVVNEDPAALLEDLSSKFLERSPSLLKEDADRLAQRLIFSSIGSMADSLIARQGEIIGAPTLKATTDYVSKNSENVTYKLVAIAAQLSYPGDPPFGAVEEYAEKLKDNVFGYRLLQGIVSRHLYMFSLPYDQRQRLADAAGVGVRQQNSIAFRSADVKKVSGRTHQPQHARSLLGKLQHSFLLRNKSATDVVISKFSKKKQSQED
ncbi:metallophosphoesterase [Janthinobacterium sp. PSPC1-1]|uniref:metallophosphoesterase n=1 Tax=Janthinobacterium sp. PSPC1-1 TaxID=2804581 RepID=UPI003CEAB6B6